VFVDGWSQGRASYDYATIAEPQLRRQLVNPIGGEAFTQAGRRLN
jgi:hypothetical protein